MINRATIAFAFLLVCVGNGLKAQTDTVTFNYVSEYEYIWTFSCLSAQFDKGGDPYVYTANNEFGFVSFNISNINSPAISQAMGTAQFNSLSVTNLYQDGNYLFASLGGFFGSGHNAGLAIMDISNPASIVITDIWDTTAFDQGTAVVVVEGDYAYLGAMEEGVLVMDVSDKNNIQFVSRLLLDPNFPEPPGILTDRNARGMEYRNDTLVVCFDSGGLRLVSVVDKQNPYEISKYVNQSLDSVAARAYNNVAIVDHYAYVPVDYCGLDVVDISDTAMTSVHWFNPWDCDTTNWNGRPGHTNEVRVLGDSLLFVSGGDSEILVFDITDRENPVLVGEYANVPDSIVAWGLDVNNTHVVCAMIDNSVWTVPYYSDYGGIQIFEWQWQGTPVGVSEKEKKPTINIYPNPTTSTLQIQVFEPVLQVQVVDPSGRVMLRSTETTLNVSDLPSGLYFVLVAGQNTSFSTRFLKL